MSLYHTLPERIEVVTTRLRMSIPERFHSDPLASVLANRVRHELDAENVLVSEAADGGVWLYFSLAETESDRPNLRAIREAIEAIAESIRSTR